MSLKFSYTLLAPVYDAIVEQAFLSTRKNSIKRLSQQDTNTVLLAGVGTGLDIPHLPEGPQYFGMDLTHAMLQRAIQRSQERNDVQLHVGNVMRLPYANEQFDIILMHLILAVVPHPVQALQEASRVLRPGGRILILDKFLRPGQVALLRRMLGLLLRHVATRTDVVIETLIEQCPQLVLTQNDSVEFTNWFRYIELQKMTNTTPAQAAA